VADVTGFARSDGFSNYWTEVWRAGRVFVSMILDTSYSATIGARARPLP
jgi:hypothetical protein